MDMIKQLAEELGIREGQVRAAVELIDDGNTIPFIARYRKEATGSLDDTILRKLHDRLEYLRNLEQRREDVIRLITEQDKMTEELRVKLVQAKTLQEIEDIYRPYKPKRRTRAMMAKEKGLEPLAELLLAQRKEEDVEAAAAGYIDAEKGVEDAQQALAGAMDIIAEQVSDNAKYRKFIRSKTLQTGMLSVKAADAEKESVYTNYYDFSEPVAKIANHRVLAINRGEKEEILHVKLEVDAEELKAALQRDMISEPSAPAAEYVGAAVCDAYDRLIAPSIENEVRNILTDEAGEKAIHLFSENLKQLLLQPPIRKRVVMGLDPGFRTGCKMAVVDETGKVLDTGIVYCTLEHHDKQKAKKVLLDVIEKNAVDIISIGNGTASRETELFAAEVIREASRDVKYVIVSEAGASVYSASELAAEEFPEYDVALRSAVSIARRLEDPLAELVKIDPKAIGVGQYQHDMNQKRLGEALGGVVEACVNNVGVDVNTASAPLLSYVSGINSGIAKNIVAYREEEGKFTSRAQLKKVKKLGSKAFEQCAGFLRILDGKNILDNTAVHPESYALAEELIRTCGYTLEDVKEQKIGDLKKKAEKIDLSAIAAQHGVGLPTVQDMIEELLKPGRDPRDELPEPVLRTDVLSMEQLKAGMVMRGTVRNITDFGAFVDIGVHQDGLVHISQISSRFIKHPMDILSIGDVVTVKIVDIDVKKGRISLTMRNIDNDLCNVANS
ncbi:MAG: RNA-binding transcriptional accessory protein [Clostridia bacterium]|nr:RNA-binding transcriptional accessory protein [Clostridia bacterium]